MSTPLKEDFQATRPIVAIVAEDVKVDPQKGVTPIRTKPNMGWYWRFDVPMIIWGLSTRNNAFFDPTNLRLFKKHIQKVANRPGITAIVDAGGVGKTTMVFEAIAELKEEDPSIAPYFISMKQIQDMSSHFKGTTKEGQERYSLDPKDLNEEFRFALLDKLWLPHDTIPNDLDYQQIIARFVKITKEANPTKTPVLIIDEVYFHEHKATRDLLRELLKQNELRIILISPVYIVKKSFALNDFNFPGEDLLPVSKMKKTVKETFKRLSPKEREIDWFEMKPLTPQFVRDVFETKTLGTGARITDDALETLMRLTQGNANAIWRLFRFLPNRENFITNLEIIQAVKAMLHGGPIGANAVARLGPEFIERLKQEEERLLSPSIARPSKPKAIKPERLQWSTPWNDPKAQPTYLKMLEGTKRYAEDASKRLKDKGIRISVEVINGEEAARVVAEDHANTGRGGLALASNANEPQQEPPGSGHYIAKVYLPDGLDMDLAQHEFLHIRQYVDTIERNERSPIIRINLRASELKRAVNLAIQDKRSQDYMSRCIDELLAATGEVETWNQSLSRSVFEKNKADTKRFREGLMSWRAQAYKAMRRIEYELRPSSGIPESLRIKAAELRQIIESLDDRIARPLADAEKLLRRLAPEFDEGPPIPQLDKLRGR